MQTISNEEAKTDTMHLNDRDETIENKMTDTKTNR